MLAMDEEVLVQSSSGAKAFSFPIHKHELTSKETDLGTSGSSMNDGGVYVSLLIWVKDLSKCAVTVLMTRQVPYLHPSVPDLCFLSHKGWDPWQPLQLLLVPKIHASSSIPGRLQSLCIYHIHQLTKLPLVLQTLIDPSFWTTD